MARYERARQHRLEWIFERVGWALMAAVVAAAAIGVFGKGWLSAAEIDSPDGTIAARYERFWRAQAPTELEVRWQAQPGDSTIWIDDAYLQHFEVMAVTPEPAAVALGAERAYYTFRVQEKTPAARATFRLVAKRSGSFAGTLGRADGAPLELRQLVFP